MYRLLHPQQMVYRSALARALAAVDARALLDSTALVAPQVIPGGTSDPAAAAGPSGEARRARLAGHGDVARVPGGLDARGSCSCATGRLPLSPLRPGSRGTRFDAGCSSSLDFESCCTERLTATHVSSACGDTFSRCPRSGAQAPRRVAD